MGFGYLTIGTNDLVRARAFYDAVMPHLGGRLSDDYPGITWCYTLDDGVRVWIGKPHDKQAAAPANGTMPGFLCASEEAVCAAHSAALANGGSDEGAPGPRPLYGPEFFGGYVRDPDGNKLCFMHSRPA